MQKKIEINLLSQIENKISKFKLYLFINQKQKQISEKIKEKDVPKRSCFIILQSFYLYQS
jgi:hypothetical protein